MSLPVTIIIAKHSIVLCPVGRFSVFSRGFSFRDSRNNLIFCKSNNKAWNHRVRASVSQWSSSRDVKPLTTLTFAYEVVPCVRLKFLPLFLTNPFHNLAILVD